MISYITLLTALALSCVSGGFSVFGLTSIFAGAYWQILMMGSILEIAKLVSVSWLYRNWTISPRFIKYFLSVIVAILILLNAIGVFGFLSRAHIEQYASMQNKGLLELSQVEQDIKVKQAQADDVTKQIDLIDDATRKLVDTKKVNQALTIETQRHKQRDGLINQRQTIIADISKLNSEKLKIDNEKQKSEAEIGPIKYVAMLIYNDSSENQVERAVRMMILLLVAVCDPTAIVLLMAAHHGFKQKEMLTKEVKTDTFKKDEVITIDNIFEIKES